MYNNVFLYLHKLYSLNLYLHYVRCGYHVPRPGVLRSPVPADWGPLIKILPQNPTLLFPLNLIDKINLF